MVGAREARVGSPPTPLTLHRASRALTALHADRRWLLALVQARLRPRCVRSTRLYLQFSSVRRLGPRSSQACEGGRSPYEARSSPRNWSSRCFRSNVLPLASGSPRIRLSHEAACFRILRGRPCIDDYLAMQLRPSPKPESGSCTSLQDGTQPISSASATGDEEDSDVPATRSLTTPLMSSMCSGHVRLRGRVRTRRSGQLVASSKRRTTSTH